MFSFLVVFFLLEVEGARDSSAVCPGFKSGAAWIVHATSLRAMMKEAVSPLDHYNKKNMPAWFKGKLLVAAGYVEEIIADEKIISDDTTKVWN